MRVLVFRPSCDGVIETIPSGPSPDAPVAALRSIVGGRLTRIGVLRHDGSATVALFGRDDAMDAASGSPPNIHLESGVVHGTVVCVCVDSNGSPASLSESGEFWARETVHLLKHIAVIRGSWLN